jgi:hypothetical protein
MLSANLTAGNAWISGARGVEVEVLGFSRVQLVYRSVVLQQGDDLPGSVGGAY